MNKRVFIFDRADSSLFPGGDTVQINAIEAYLKKRNYSVVKSGDLNSNLSDYDVILIFNLQNPFEAYLQAYAANKANKPYIFFPVYWNMDSLKMDEGSSIKSKIKSNIPLTVKNAIKYFRFLYNQNTINTKVFVNIKQAIKFVLTNAYYICPNSIAELNHLKKEFNIGRLNTKSKVIYNGIDVQNIEASIKQNFNSVEDLKLPQKFICCIGGIGPRKNQLNLVKAANRNSELPLVIIGKVSRGCESYAREVKKVANKNVIFIDYLHQTEVFKVLKMAHAHIQPSYIETPGLASLEAAVLGCLVGVAKVPPVEEYFQEKVYYCDPYDVDSISECIVGLFNSKKNEFNLDSVRHKYDVNYTLIGLAEIISNV